jgi:hypothetical protein
MALYNANKVEELLIESIKFLDPSSNLHVWFNFEAVYDEPPDCINEVEIIDIDDGIVSMHYFEITILSKDDLKSCNEWLLRVAGKSAESRHLSLISILIYHSIVDRFARYKRYTQLNPCVGIDFQTTVRNFLTYAPAIINRFDVPFLNMASNKIEDIVASSDFYDTFHKSIRAVRIQRIYQKYMGKKHRAASIIQKEWRRVISDPSCNPCKNMILWEFQQMCQ